MGVKEPKSRESKKRTKSEKGILIWGAGFCPIFHLKNFEEF